MHLLPNEVHCSPFVGPSFGYQIKDSIALGFMGQVDNFVRKCKSHDSISVFFGRTKITQLVFFRGTFK